jgi:hypothetical protein
MTCCGRKGRVGVRVGIRQWRQCAAEDAEILRNCEGKVFFGAETVDKKTME